MKKISYSKYKQASITMTKIIYSKYKIGINYDEENKLFKVQRGVCARNFT